MSKIYAEAPSGVAEKVAHLVKVFHPDLQAAGVRFDLLSVSDDNEDVEHALKLRGYPVYACVKAVDIKGRTKGRGDVEIQIDEAKYLAMNDAQRDSLLDHEIEHVELVLNKKTQKVKLDCRGRPKVKMRLHDVEVGWFTNIAERHGIASIECKQATQMFLNHSQTLFAFVDQPMAIEAPAAKMLADGSIEKKIVQTADGRGITPTAMVDEIQARFSKS